jgi:methionyl-tRNA formyltransferase
LRVLFWGTPEFSLPSFRALLGEGHDVVGVVTQPDRPSGRGRKLRSSAVKRAALEERIPVLTPEKPRGKAFLDALGAFRPEISVVVAYGHILIPEVLDLPERGSINLHASLLPELRGAAPINWALARGHERTGITVMRMTEGMDEGPILLQREVPISAEDTAGTLSSRLSEVGAEALVEALALLEVGALEPTEQDRERATYAPKVDREVARIDWARSARDVANHIRGMDPFPGAWTVLRGGALKLFQPRVGETDSDAAPGTVLKADPVAGLVVKAGAGCLGLDAVQPAGKRRMDTEDWLRGGGPAVGDLFKSV